MSNLEHVELLKKGAAEWNLWRSQHPEVRPDLQAADLSWLNLSDCDLSQADLSGATLHATHVLGANLTQANLTGACIQDWNINSDTVLDDVVCDFIYLKNGQQERRPSDPEKQFSPDDFAQLYKKRLETIDLIFLEDIDWKALLRTFQTLQANKMDENTAIQSIERQSNGEFIIRLEVGKNVDKDLFKQEIHRLYQSQIEELKHYYEFQLAAKDQEVEFYRHQNSNLTEIIKVQANRPINVQTNIRTANSGEITVKSPSQRMSESEATTKEDENIFQTAYDNIFGNRNELRREPGKDKFHREPTLRPGRWDSSEEEGFE